MKTIFKLLNDSFWSWYEDRAMRMGAALAYYSVFALAPLLVMVISIAGLVFGYLIDRTGSWTLPFAGSICLLLLGAALAFRMHPDRPFEVTNTP